MFFNSFSVIGTGPQHNPLHPSHGKFSIFIPLSMHNKKSLAYMRALEDVFVNVTLILLLYHTLGS